MPERLRHIRILAGLLDRTAGSHVYHLELATRFARRGHRVSVICFGGGPEVDSLPFHVIALPKRALMTLPMLWRFTAIGDYLICNHLIRSAVLDAPDVTVGGEHLWLRAHAKRFPHRPWIYLPHSLLLEHELSSYGLSPLAHRTMLSVYENIQTWAMRNADRTLRFTQYGCDVLEAHHGPRAKARYFVNPIGIDLPTTPSRVGSASELRLLTVGGLHPGKRVNTALRALSSCRTLRWRYDIVGDGEQMPALRALADELGLGNRVFFHGQMNDPKFFYREADLLLFPSRSESLGLVLLEAMSHGIPTLAMRADGSRFFNPFAEILNDRHDSFLADDDHDFTRILGRLLRKPDLLAAAGQRARDKVEASFSWESHLDRYESLFRTIALDRIDTRP